MLNDYQSSTQGGYAEGWNYLEYGAKTYLPFMAAYHRWAGGETLPYYGVPTIQIESPHANKVDLIADFAVNERTRAVFERALWSVQPDGLMPNTDDANPAPLPGGLLAWMFDEPTFLWQWFKPAVSFHSWGLDTASFALHDGTLPPDEPGEPLEGSFQDAGFAIFRDSWGPDATYLVLQGEHGTVREHGEGHEHADELSFLLWAHGRPLLIDPGYIDWDHHDMVRYASDHNTILVDGKGSPVSDVFKQFVGVDAFLSKMVSEGSITWVEVQTKYQGVSFVRRLVRVDKAAFVIEDRMDGGGMVHTYSLLLNGMGGGDVPDSLFKILNDGGRWNNAPATVDAHILPVSGPWPASISHDLQEHATGHGVWAMHERLVADAVMDDPAGFLSAILTSSGADETPETSSGQYGPGTAWVSWASGEKCFHVVSNQTNADVGAVEQNGPFPPGLTIGIFEHGCKTPGDLIEVHHL
ncbi:MAG: hypothetical protein GXP54_04655, partial [Deltaproteobacteria bacterium]|nr:hypothetical protein [Deltaproteobacteria bacterium]